MRWCCHSSRRSEEKKREVKSGRRDSGRKVDGRLKALADWFGEDDRDCFLADGSYGLVDIAAGSCLGYIKVRFPEQPLRKLYPHLDQYDERLEARQSFRDTVPKPQNKIV